jgi:transposase
MTRPDLSRLSSEEKDALILALLERVAALEAKLGGAPKGPGNSSIPPSRGQKANRPARPKRPRRKRDGPGVTRTLAETPDHAVDCHAKDCPHCGSAIEASGQTLRQSYDHIDLPPIRPVVTRIRIFGRRCRACGRRVRGAPPAAMLPGTPFGPSIRALLAYLHHSHHVGYERLTGLCQELFGLKISEGAIANALRRLEPAFQAAMGAIKERLLTAQVIASDETTTRVDGVTHWHWVFLSDRAVLHQIAQSRARKVAAELLGEHRPEVWVSDRYAGQQELGQNHQVCLAHVLRDVQYAIDCGDTVVAPKIRDHLRWAIRVGKRRSRLKETTLAVYAAKAERGLDILLATPADHPAGRDLQRQIKAWRGKFFVFLADPRVPATNNGCEREIRPSVIFRKVTNGFRSTWGPNSHAGYRSVTGTARLQGISPWTAIRALISGTFAPA